MSETGLHAWRYLSSEADSVADSATPRSNRCPPGEAPDPHRMCDSPLPVSQSHFDLESFAASILMDDHVGHLEHSLPMDLTGNTSMLLGLDEGLDSTAGCSMQAQPPPPQPCFSQYSDGMLHRGVEMCSGAPPVIVTGVGYSGHMSVPGGADRAAPAECFNAFLLDTAEFQGAPMGLSDMLEDSARAQLSRTASLPPNPNRHLGHLSFQHSEPCSPGGRIISLGRKGRRGHTRQYQCNSIK